MAIPSSGTLRFSQIRTELGTTNGSLRALSSLAGKSTPDRISEFYGYSSGVPVNYYYYNYTGGGCWFTSFQVRSGTTSLVTSYDNNTSGTVTAPVGISLNCRVSTAMDCIPPMDGSSEVYYYLNGNYVTANVVAGSGFASVTVASGNVTSGNTYEFYGYSYPYV